MALHAITILPLSDLHERGPHEKEQARRWRVLGDVWRSNLAELRNEGPVDLVCFTGDLANWGHAAEYEPAGAFLQDELLSPLGVPRERLFLVPGNHDIDRKTEPAAWQAMRELLPRLDALDAARWLAGGPAPLGGTDALREALLARQAAYRGWLKAWGRPALLPEASAHGRLGYRVSLRLDKRPFDVHVLGLDSAWLAGDGADAGNLRLTDGQILRLATDERGRPLGGLRLALVHHPLSDLADGAQARRLLADHVDLLLRGHVHETDLELHADPDRRLLQLAAGCLYEGGRGDQHPNSCHLIRIFVDDDGRPQRYEIRFRSFSPRGGFWHDDSSLYKAAQGGRLVLDAEGRVLKEPRHFRVPLTPNPYFTGREQTLAELRAALRERHLAVVTQPQALSGLGGVGKTQIALAYADRYRTDYDAVFWLDAASEEAVSTGFAAIAAELGLLGDEPAKSVPDSAALLRLWLSKNPRWLLVLDNADEPCALRRLLSRPEPIGTFKKRASI